MAFVYVAKMHFAAEPVYTRSLFALRVVPSLLLTGGAIFYFLRFLWNQISCYALDVGLSHTIADFDSIHSNVICFVRLNLREIQRL